MKRFICNDTYYIIPGIPPPIGGIPAAGVSSLISIKAHSVVKIIPATEAAFSKATRVTFLGSIIPASKHVYIGIRFGIVSEVFFTF